MHRPRVFFDFSIGSEAVGRFGVSPAGKEVFSLYFRVIFELFSDTVPKTTEK